MGIDKFRFDTIDFILNDLPSDKHEEALFFMYRVYDNVTKRMLDKCSNYKFCSVDELFCFKDKKVFEAVKNKYKVYIKN